jgi:hypothetical protein
LHYNCTFLRQQLRFYLSVHEVYIGIALVIPLSYNTITFCNRISYIIYSNYILHENDIAFRNDLYSIILMFHQLTNKNKNNNANNLQLATSLLEI